MSAVAVEPRLRERRIAVNRDAGRRRLRRLLVLAGVVGVAVLGLASTLTPALDVDEVTVRGASRTTTEEVTAAAGVEPGDPLAWFDTGAAERAVAELAWVDEVQVDRSWSGAIRIEVTERAPAAALVAADGGWLVADGEGRVLAAVDEQPTDVALLDGVSSTAAVGEALDDEVLDALRVAAAVPDVLADDVALVRGVGADVELDLRQGGVVVLGGAEDAAEKLAAAAAVLGAVPPGCVDRLDVSLPAAPALVRAPGC